MTPFQTSLQPLGQDQDFTTQHPVFGRGRSASPTGFSRKFKEISTPKPTSIFFGLITKMCSQVSVFTPFNFTSFSGSFLGGREGLSAINPRVRFVFRSRKPAGGWGKIFVFGLGLILGSIERINKNLFPSAYAHACKAMERKKSLTPIFHPESHRSTCNSVATAGDWVIYGLNPLFPLNRNHTIVIA